MEWSSVHTELRYLEILPPYFLPMITVSIKSMLSWFWVARQAVSGEEKAMLQKERREIKETDKLAAAPWTLIRGWGPLQCQTTSRLHL